MRRRAILTLALAASAAALPAAPALAAKDDVVLISRATGPSGAPADDRASEPSISRDGDRVAFVSEANNLSTDDDNAVFSNVFVRDAGANTTTLVSRAPGRGGVGGNDFSSDAAISGDGRFVAFSSEANNLSTDDDNGVRSIFVRDLVANTTTLVSRRSGANGAGASDDSFIPSISDDGTRVAFESRANNLSTADGNALENIFVRDLAANTTRLVSRAPGAGGAGANDDSYQPSISGDGDRVAFLSDANNVSTEDDNAVLNVFVRDLEAGTNQLVSRATGAGGVGGHGNSDMPRISRSGRFVAFRSAANNLSREDDNAVPNIFLRDLDAATTVLVSRANGAGGAAADDDSYRPVVSDNGRVAFESVADNLSADDDNAITDVFVRDTLDETTTLVTRAAGPAGAAANDTSIYASTSADGRFVAFGSAATNLVPGTVADVNVFRRDVLGDAPVATPACKSLPLPPAPADKSDVVFTLSVGQLKINQRISQAAIRRLNALQARLDGGLAARDLCGYSVGPTELGPGITSAPAAASLAPAAPADPAPITDPGRSGQGDPLTLSAAQLLINQRIDQAAIRRATGITNRLDAGLTGGDIKAAQVTQAKLYDRLQILAKTPTAEPPSSTTTIPPRQSPPDPGSVTLSVGQLRINQRISQAGVRNANALIRRLETGLSGADLKPATLTAADLG
jgi:Tol biopolymer transport system component